ncbi:unnamed protein product [Mytilus edulis]|uniref:Uncharacterized protein n=1 Tax=Mytilus edulis TaxID=6550 RepID=A0A8S3SGB0_MYTED|nr:unnamed protein product [Mytilus edulis]
MLLKGQNTNIYDLYMDSELTYNINDDDAQNFTHGHGKHFKSDIINYWEDIDVEQVKVVVYQNGMEQAFLSFDGTRTNKTNWFSQERLMNTTYSDLKTEETHQPGEHPDVQIWNVAHALYLLDLSATGVASTAPLSHQYDSQSRNQWIWTYWTSGDESCPRQRGISCSC